MMNYRQTLEYLYSRLPVFQRIGAAAYKPDLNNTLALLEACGNPHIGLRSVHIAGTNGKGSTSHMLSSIFQEAGYKVGLYTSPHLKDFRERIRINGKMISRNAVVDFVKNNRAAIEKISPSFFEVTVALAFDYFKQQKTDIAIIETGLGGRLDSTNVILPELSVITNISFDHVQFLGNTIEKIAFEKAGIIKDQIPVVIGEFNKESAAVFQAVAKAKHTTIHFASKLRLKKKYPCQLKGEYQIHNIKTVICSIQILQHKNWKILEQHIRRGIAKVVDNTGLRGRWETIALHPKIICDIGHNAAGIKVVTSQLKKEKYKQLHMVIGAVNDKDISSMLKSLPKNAQYYFCKAAIPRALPETELMNLAKSFKLNGKAYPTVKRALNAAKKNASSTDLIFVGGSAFVVAEAL